jgi:hypothetical protein
MSVGCDMRKASKIVPINSVKRRVIKHQALSTPKEEVTQHLHCRSTSNRIDFFLGPLLSSKPSQSGPPSGKKRSLLTIDERSAAAIPARVDK